MINIEGLNDAIMRAQERTDQLFETFLNNLSGDQERQSQTSGTPIAQESEPQPPEPQPQAQAQPMQLPAGQSNGGESLGQQLIP